MSFSGCLDCRGVLSGEKSGLQLSGPVKEFRQCQHRITRETMFRVRFAVVMSVEASKCRSQTSQCTDESQIDSAVLRHQPKAGFLDELEAFLRFRLHLGKRVSHDEVIRDQRMPAICGKRKDARSICH